MFVILLLCVAWLSVPVWLIAMLFTMADGGPSRIHKQAFAAMGLSWVWLITGLFAPAPLNFEGWHFAPLAAVSVANVLVVTVCAFIFRDEPRRTAGIVVSALLAFVWLVVSLSLNRPSSGGRIL